MYHDFFFLKMFDQWMKQKAEAYVKNILQNRAKQLMNSTRVYRNNKRRLTNKPTKKDTMEVDKPKKFTITYKKTRTKGPYNTVGRFRGKFKRTKKSKRDIYMEKGIVNRYENGGVLTCNEQGCQYIGHAIAFEKVMVNVCCAIIKKLFIIAGINSVNSVDQYFGLDSTQNWAISYSYTPDDSSGSVRGSIPISSTSSLNSLAVALKDQWVVDFSSDKKYVLTEIQLGPSDGATPDATVTDVRARLGGDNIHVHFECLSYLSVQNRTKASTGAVVSDADIDLEENITNNPLVGKVYEFNYLPTPYNEGLNVFKSISSTNGVKLVRAAEVALATGGNFFKEPPIPKIFRNCRKSTTIRLEPGSIKYHNLIDFVSKNVLLWLEDIAFSNIEDLTRVKCKVGLIALEDVINVNEAQLITLAYECQKSYSVYTETKRKVSILTDFASNEIDNLTP